MSSLKNAHKARAKSHRERSQPSHRKHLGILEKKKDYKLRAIDAHKKRSTLKYLEKQALNRNPDEFYFNMVKTVKKDGVHQLRDSAESEHTEDQIKLMYTQDQNYINMKRSSELKKIERLKSSLHLIDSDEKPENSHTIFVDSKKEAKRFNAAEHFKTHPALLGRRFNRPTIQKLKRGDFVDMEKGLDVTAESMKRSKYSELKKRIEREQQLTITAQKMERKKQLLKDPKGKRVSKETKNSAAQYKWTFKRKR